jgi:adenylosuccinate synthase
VLSGFENVQVCDGYQIGSEISSQIPFNLMDEAIIPQYKSFPGWKEDLTKIRDFNALPDTFKTYISYVESMIDVPINIISVGPDREETIHK